MQDKLAVNERHPIVSLLLLLIFMTVGLALSTALAALLCGLIFGFDHLLRLTTDISGNINSLKIIQLFNAVGTFILPAWILARKENKLPYRFLKLDVNINFLLLALAVVVYYAFTPVIEWSIIQNSHMKLPGFLKVLEDWMREKEDSAAVLTRELLMMKSPLDLIINLVVIAIIPGIGEELVFRGVMQQMLIKSTKNYHLGIWLAAIIFSAIHVQFFGFVPRMLLGALFGYLFYWSKNLFIPIIAHTLNNATTLVAAYLMQMRGEPLDSVESSVTYPFYITWLSFGLGLALLLYYKKRAQEVMNYE